MKWLNSVALLAENFVTTSLCSPSRASFLSGMYPHRHGVLNNFTDYPKDLPSFPRSLKAAGYETAYIGKWHMGEDDDSARPGFDYWISHKGQGSYFDTTFNINGNRQLVKGYYTHAVTDMAVDWLKKPHQKPFLLCLGHKAPHGKWFPEPKYEHVYDNVEIRKPATAYETGPNTPSFVKERIKTWHGIDGNLYGHKDYEEFVRNYHATILSVDDSIGGLYDTLRQMGELNNTLIVFAGDNGLLLGDHGLMGKQNLYEFGGMHVPLVLAGPGIPKGRSDALVYLMDLFPTLADYAGAKVPKGVEGRSLRPVIEGKVSKVRDVLYTAYRDGMRAVRDDRWKLIRYPLVDKTQLFDLAADPRELSNLAYRPQHSGKIAELTAATHKPEAAFFARGDDFPDALAVGPAPLRPVGTGIPGLYFRHCQ